MSHMTRNAVNSWLIGLAISLTATMVTAGEASIQVGRYTVVTAVATAAQTDPLQTMVTIRFPEPHITTVSDAIRYLLRHSGYRLAKSEAADPAMAPLLGHLLPKVHRHLGPMTLQNMLATLTGTAYQIVVDPVNRLIAFDLAPAYRPMERRPDDLEPAHTVPACTTKTEPGERHEPSA
ncbi:MAG: hypothetical protein JMN25_17590 [gamma proteobacterium endosymbiont of Lamellibrachia anaximandri]|nr:hypothetical protein [gamma proteobacterium endosymbiont of Lamellibrachia anaximandri]